MLNQNIKKDTYENMAKDCESIHFFEDRIKRKVFVNDIHICHYFWAFLIKNTKEANPD